jgi:hypothetical protein
MVLELTLGACSALFIAAARRLGARRQTVVSAGGLIVAALIYVGFALVGVLPQDGWPSTR